MKRLVCFGFIGPTLDRGFDAGRWASWRPSVALCQQDDLLIHRLELFYTKQSHEKLGRLLCADIASISPESETHLHHIPMKDPWDFEEVYAVLHDFARAYPFNPDEEDYLVHITTGTHVAQICLFLLSESRHFPGRIIQTHMVKKARDGPKGEYHIVDLDLSRYDRLAARFGKERVEGVSYLKSGIETRNEAFNKLMEQIERVAIHSREPLLLTGPTGAGKSQLARRIYELKKIRRQVTGAFVEVNCATIRGDGAMSALFGHKRGAFTGALNDREGLLRAANGGILFLDEIGELGIEEQAMLLRALEEKRFLPVGSDREVEGDFQLLSGTNRDLQTAVRNGAFREDLLARIDLWTFRLPGLRDRPQDIEPNIDYELDRFEQRNGTRVTFNKEARESFLKFAIGPDAEWRANFRDLNAGIVRMATLAGGGRITVELVREEIDRLRRAWQSPADGPRADDKELLQSTLSPGQLTELDAIDAVQLAEVLRVCRASRSLSDAGRKLYNVSRTKKSSVNDADRLKKYLARFALEWKGIASYE